MSGKYTDEQLEELKDVFYTYDSDGSGNIDIDELRSVLTTLEIHHSPADLLQVFKKIDVDGSGAIDWNEFVELMKNDLYYNAYMIKTVRDGIRRQSRGLDSIQEDLARLGYQVSEDGVVDVAKKIVCGYVTVDEFKKMLNDVKD